jgi:hypothetical protein
VREGEVMDREYWYEVVHVEKHRVTRLIKAPSKERAMNLAEWGDVGKEIHDVRNDFVPFEIVCAKRVRSKLGDYKLVDEL